MRMRIAIESISKVKEFNARAVNFPCKINIVSDRYVVDGRSLMGLFSLDLSKPVEMEFSEIHFDLAKLCFGRFEVKNEN